MTEHCERNRESLCLVHFSTEKQQFISNSQTTEKHLLQALPVLLTKGGKVPLQTVILNTQEN